MNVFESIAAVQADVEFIGKNKQVQSGGSYKYRGVDQVLNTLHPLFVKHKLFAVPEVLEILEREVRETTKGGKVLYQVLKIRYTFYAEDGSNISAVVVGEAMDSGDKVSNKCMSVAYKYACFQLLSIPTEETTADPDDENESFVAQEKRERVKTQRPITREELESYGVADVKATAQWIYKKYEKPVVSLTDAEADEVRSMLRRKQEERKAAQEYLQKAQEDETETPF